MRELLKEKGLPSAGNKQELIERLQANASESSGELNEDDLLGVSLLSEMSRGKSSEGKFIVLG